MSELRQMVQQGTLGGVLLVIAALVAMVIANSPLAASYQALLDLPIAVSIGGFAIDKPLLLWINDGLMAVFFFMIGLEVKREIFDGHLASRDQIMLPGIAAVAGIALPALIYAFFNYEKAVAVNGWAIPAATDIAFALGVFSLFGRTLPITLKLFLLSVAIFDDIGAIIIIALFYSGELAELSLIIGLTGMVVLFIFNRLGVSSYGAYLLVGLVIWAAVLKSGVHATLAGFAAAWFIPLRGKDEDGHEMLHHLEHKLQPWVALFILPVFAFANAGVSLLGMDLNALHITVITGIMAGLFVGKQVGIFGACYLAVKVGLAKLPEGVNWRQMYAVSILCGIGFTMSLFIGSLAFETAGSEYMSSVKLGVLAGSILSAVFGALVIKWSSKGGQGVPARALDQASDTAT
ncbi:Na+/H+ antiporter NhaA [Aliiglaciecola sp. CAU 1673]|uniref:Na+/H+ antiporter NhaA n=1 Tax=Aliiglaciecola sp. CAU 1673 TaxID=3032595 RepID=UPI0023DBB0AC|nr:Na+/H+ antiporter NhaA [Aliiglaciecola sp. CAU 1673]MDF2180237.1 Na+/H+ antiporter NhaA [Aliiglaciecola sp. CAU 1673]